MFLLRLTIAFALAGIVMPDITDLPPPKGVKVVFVGFRHGNRNPVEFLKDDPNEGKWGQEGPAMLTKIGKQQSYAYGQQLRKRYGNIIDDNWRPEQVKAYSSSADRTQGTVQTVLAGLFPPKGYELWNENLLWQPISYKVDDELLRAYSVPCPVGKAAFDKVYNGETPEGQKLIRERKEVIQYVAEATGLKPTLSDMAEVADNLAEMYRRGLKLPSWVTNNSFNESLYNNVTEMTDAPQVLCSKYSQCRKTMAGYWLNDIVKKLGAKSNETRMYIYSTHNEIVSSLLWLMGHERPYGVRSLGSGVLEYRDSPSEAVRLLYNEPKFDDPTKGNSEVIKMKFCPQNDEWCPLDNFTAAMEDKRVDNFGRQCKRPICFCSPYPDAPKKSVPRDAPTPEMLFRILTLNALRKIFIAP